MFHGLWLAYFTTSNHNYISKLRERLFLTRFQSRVCAYECQFFCVYCSAFFRLLPFQT